jgi:hypothetical protein
VLDDPPSLIDVKRTAISEIAEAGGDVFFRVAPVLSPLAKFGGRLR